MKALDAACDHNSLRSQGVQLELFSECFALAICIYNQSSGVGSQGGLQISFAVGSTRWERRKRLVSRQSELR